jgi:hypothetical protein
MVPPSLEKNNSLIFSGQLAPDVFQTKDQRGFFPALSIQPATQEPPHLPTILLTVLAFNNQFQRQTMLKPLLVSGAVIV